MEFEMQNRRGTVVTFKEGSLSISGHHELDGTYHKGGPERTPLELLQAGENQKAYEGFRALGLDQNAIVHLVRQCQVNCPSRWPVLFEFAKFLVAQSPNDLSFLHLAAAGAIAIGERKQAEGWYSQILKVNPDDAAALKALKMMGHLPTSEGWKLPFSLAAAYAPPTAAELSRVRADWKTRDLKPRDIRKEYESTITLSEARFQATVISYRVHGQRNHGVILTPCDAQQSSYPILIELKGVSPSYFPLRVPQGILTPKILGNDLRNFVVFVPAVRGEQLLFADQTYSCEGDPDNSWDGATDDAIAFLSAGLEVCPLANPERIIAFGKSRGGTVAMLLGARDPRVRALVSWSGPAGWIENMPQFGWSQFELVREALSTKAPPVTTGGQALRTFFKPALDGKMTFTQTRDRLIASSPIYFLSDMPSAQLHYGVNDHVVTIEEGKRIEAALNRLDSKMPDVRIIYEVDGGHDLNPKTAVPSTKSFLLKHAGRR
jgi:pimeloyl-ACP methyl ester carboxylesterase